MPEGTGRRWWGAPTIWLMGLDMGKMIGRTCCCWQPSSIAFSTSSVNSRPAPDRPSRTVGRTFIVMARVHALCERTAMQDSTCSQTWSPMQDSWHMPRKVKGTYRSWGGCGAWGEFLQLPSMRQPGTSSFARGASERVCGHDRQQEQTIGQRGGR